MHTLFVTIRGKPVITAFHCMHRPGLVAIFLNSLPDSVAHILAALKWSTNRMCAPFRYKLVIPLFIPAVVYLPTCNRAGKIPKIQSRNMFFVLKCICRLTCFFFSLSCAMSAKAADLKCRQTPGC